MRIAGMDISVYGAKQWAVSRGYGNITNNSEWVEGAAAPMMMSGTVGFKKIKVDIIVKGSSRDEIWRNGNKLIASLLEPKIIELDGFTTEFYAFLNNAEQAELSIRRWHKASLELIGYEQGIQVIQSGAGTTFTVNNVGTALTPCIIELLPSIGKVSMTLYGFTRDRTGTEKPIIVSGLNNGKKIIIDGELGLVTEEGINKIADINLWDFPTLLPGANEIVTDQSDISVTVKYKPRYL